MSDGVLIELLVYLLEKLTVPQLDRNNRIFSANCVFIFVVKESSTCLYSASDESNQFTNLFP